MISIPICALSPLNGFNPTTTNWRVPLTKRHPLSSSELFSTQGYDSVSVGETAKAVGIKPPLLYSHFPFPVTRLVPPKSCCRRRSRVLEYTVDGAPSNRAASVLTLNPAVSGNSAGFFHFNFSCSHHLPSRHGRRYLRRWLMPILINA